MKLVEMAGGIALALGLSLAGAAGATPIVYTVNETITGPLNGQAGNPTQTDSVVGSITTDGAIGVLHASDLVSWNLDLIDVINPSNSIVLTQANSLISVDTGSVLNASATGLFFNFSGTGAFAFQADSPGAFSGYHYWCLSEGWFGCLDGNSIAPGDVYGGDPADDLVVAASGTQGQVGNSPLNQPPAGGVPEPGMWALMLAGVGLVGASLRASRRERSGETAAA